MRGKAIPKTSSSWGFKTGPGILIWVFGGMVLITIFAWRSGANWKWIFTGLTFLVLILLALFGEQTKCFLDIERREFLLQKIKVWKKSERKIPFDEIVQPAVKSSGSGTRSRTHNLILALSSGERISLDAHPSTTKWTKDKKAQKIAEIINQTRKDPIIPALNGIVRVRRQGETRGIPWEIESITANNSVRSTIWFCSKEKLDDGFLLLIPAVGSNSSGAGKLSKTSRFFYNQYLSTLMIEESMPLNFKNAFQLNKEDFPLGNHYTCVTNKPAEAIGWFNESFSGILDQWIPPQRNKPNRDLHILVNPDGVRLLFREIYYLDSELAQIADLGTTLIELHHRSK